MATFLFYFGIPVFFGLLQFFMIRSKNLSIDQKALPALLVGLVAGITWLAVFDFIPLPKTYFLDGGGGFLSFPDFFYIALSCFPASLGLIFGALFGIGGPGRK